MKRRAFTLIELLIVIAIIGILSSVVYISLNSAKKKANDAKIKNDTASMSTALEVVKVDRDLEALTTWTVITDSTTTPANDSNINRWTDGGSVSGATGSGTRLLKSLPTNPYGSFEFRTNSAGSSYALLAPLSGGNRFWCNSNGNGREIEKAAAQARTDCATGM